MKKLIALMLVAVALLLAMASCSEKCDTCGKSGASETVTLNGKTYPVCEDCYNKLGLGAIDGLDAGNLF